MKNKCSNNILRDLKSDYKINNDLRVKDPKIIRCVICGLILALIFTVIFEFLSIYYRTITLVSLFLFSLLMTIVCVICYKKQEKKYKDVLKKKWEDNRLIRGMIIEDEAKKYEVTPECLALYLLKERKNPVWLNIVTFCITFTFTGYAVYCLPGYDQINHGAMIFVGLLVANMITSSGATIVCNELQTTMKQEFDFYVIMPFEEEFEKIEEKCKGEK